MKKFYLPSVLVMLPSLAYAFPLHENGAESGIQLARPSEADKAAKRAEAERKQAEKDAKKAEAAFRHRLVLAEQYLVRAGRNLGDDEEVRSLSLALRQYDELTTEEKKRSEAQEFKARYDVAKAKSDRNIKDSEASVALSQKRREAEVAYAGRVGELERALFQLRYYRDPTAKPTSGFADWFSRFEIIQQAFPGFEKLAAECDSSYVPLLANGSAREQVLANCDVAKNRVSYRERFVVGNASGAIVTRVDAYAKAIESLSNAGCWTGFYADNVTNYERAYRAVVDPVTSAYRAIQMPVPESEFARIPAMKVKYETAVQAAVNRNKPSAAQYAYSTQAMKAALERAADSVPISLVKYGMAKNEWVVEKNKATGIPLHQWGNGTVLLKRKGDSFCREYKVAFFKDYTGDGYTDIGRVEFAQSFVPAKCQ